ncbi:MAG: hypothetical protein HZA28_05595 [Candidatus Omnitrophica bacterium]|nr:hypothetical protein [Candidatus Omnitrophota bacterium]
MKKLILCGTLCFITSLAFAQDFEKFIGKWMSQGEPLLVVKSEGDSIKLEFPDNPTWRAEFQNVRIEEDKLKFEQLNYLKDGRQHPFNGVINHCEMWQESDGKMYFRLWTDYMKDEPPTEIIKSTE